MKFKQFWKNLTFKSVIDAITRGAKAFWKVLSNRFGMKLLSLVLAILLWNYVITTNTSITRNKTIDHLNGYLTNQSVLTGNKLALIDDAEQMMTDVSVILSVPQADYARVSADNVKVTLDLSGVRTAGVQQVPLKATTSYGKIQSVYPEALTLTFDTLDSRVVPVNVQASGEKDARLWYSVSRTNPTSITVSGAASIVRSLTQARVNSDVTGARESYLRAEPYMLVDSSGGEIPQAMLSCSSSSISVLMDIYPTKEVPISTLSENVIVGAVADGYAVTDISIQPDKITVAADQELLNGISELYIEPIDVEGANQSLSARAKIIKLNDFKNVSAEQVLVNITIAEETETVWFDDVPLDYVNLADDLTMEAEAGTVRVCATGTPDAIRSLEAADLTARVDLQGRGAGGHSCAVELPEEMYPDIELTSDPKLVRVYLEPRESE